MRYYLNDIEITPLVAPTIGETKDRTLDSATFEYQFSDKRECFKPMSDFRIEETNETLNFVVVSDQVETIKKGSTQAYKHSLTLAQSPRKFSKIPVRNSVFSNYYNQLNIGYTSRNVVGASFGTEQSLRDNYDETITIKNNGDYLLNIEVSIDYMTNASGSTYYSQYGKVVNATIPLIKLVKANDLTSKTTIASGVFVSDETTLKSNVYLEKGTYIVSIAKATFNKTISIDGTVAPTIRARVEVLSTQNGNSLFNLLDTLNKQIALSDDNFTNQKPFVLPYTTSDEFYQTLVNTEAPEFTFTQMNLYECISTILGFLDGEPTLDKKNKLGIDYFNDKNKTKTTLSDKTNYSSSIGEEKYCNGLLVDINKGHTENAITIPNKYSALRIRYLDYGVQQENENWGIPLPHPIDYIKRVYVYLNGTFNNYSGGNVYFNNTKLDLTSCVISETQYLLLNNSALPSNRPKTDLVRQNCIKYSRGDNFLSFGGSYQNTTYLNTDILISAISKAISRTFGYNDLLTDFYEYPRTTKYNTQLTYQIEYVPIIQTRMVIQGNENKYNGFERLDQSTGDVSLNRLGQNMFGQVSMLGNETRHLTQQFNDFETRIKKGTIWNDNGEEWVANNIQNTLYKDFNIQNIEFTKNFNSLSNFIKLNQNKRFSNIDNSIVQRSEDVYCEYVYISQTDTITSENIHFYNQVIKNSILNMLTNTDSVEFPTYAIFRNGNTDISMNFAKYGSGNALCFEFGFDEPMSAGKYLDSSSGENIWKPIIYTDKDGSKDLITLFLVSVASDYSTGLNPDYPLIVDYTKFTILADFTNLQFYKKPNEIFALNYEIIFLPAPKQDIFFGEQFINNNLLLDKKPNLPFKIYYSSSERYSILDKKALGSEYSGNGNWKLTSNHFEYGANITISGVSVWTTFVLPVNTLSWCICDQDNNILIAFNVLNVSSVHTTPIEFYIANKHTRL